LKQRIDFAITQIELLVQKLDLAEDKFYQRYEAIFTRLFEAYTKHETTCACGLAFERAEARQLTVLIINSKTALEQIILLLRTTSETNDKKASLGTALSVLTTFKSQLAKLFPETEEKLIQISKILGEIVVEANQGSETALNINTVEKEAEKILSEVKTIAEQKIEKKFPPPQ
jgi:division protein CdvB (Snf7/Vps24/ESCRT-III family)